MPLKLAVLSTSRIVAEFMDHLAEMPEIEVTALCCRPQSEAKAKAMAQAHGVPRVFTDEDACYAAGGFDAVYIGTANHLHYTAAKKALEAIKSGDATAMGKIFAAEQRNISELADLTSPEVDWLVRRVQELEGTSCSRLIGRGLRGCTFSMIKKEVFDIYMEKLDEYERIFGFHPAIYRVKTSDSIKII